MAIWQYLLILAGGLLLVFAACMLPGRFFRIFGTVAINAASGLALLFALNLIFGETFTLPLNAGNGNSGGDCRYLSAAVSEVTPSGCTDKWFLAVGASILAASIPYSSGM